MTLVWWTSLGVHASKIQYPRLGELAMLILPRTRRLCLHVRLYRRLHARLHVGGMYGVMDGYMYGYFTDLVLLVKRICTAAQTARPTCIYGDNGVQPRYAQAGRPTYMHAIISRKTIIPVRLYKPFAHLTRMAVGLSG